MPEEIFKTQKVDLIQEFPLEDKLDFNFPGKIHTTICKCNFMYIIFSDSKICIINKSDYSLLQLYEGLDETVNSVEYNETYIYIHFTNNTLYRTKYTKLNYELKNSNAILFSINEFDNILILDSKGRIFLDGNIKDEFQFDIKYLKLVKENICIVKTNTMIWKEKEIQIQNFLFGYQNFIVDSKGIYDLKNEIYFKIRNVESIKLQGKNLFVTKASKTYKIVNAPN